MTTGNWHCTGKKEFDEATQPQQLDLTGFRLHPLRDDLAGYWSITVSANWRIIYRFDGKAVVVATLARPELKVPIARRAVRRKIFP